MKVIECVITEKSSFRNNGSISREFTPNNVREHEQFLKVAMALNEVMAFPKTVEIVLYSDESFTTCANVTFEAKDEKDLVSFIPYIRVAMGIFE